MSKVEFVSNNLVLILTPFMILGFFGFIFLYGELQHWGIGEQIKNIIKDTSCDNLKYNYFYSEFQKPKYKDDPDYNSILKTLNQKIQSCGLNNGSES